MDKKLEQLREEYQNVPIPKELDEMVEKALQHGLGGVGVDVDGRGK